MPSRTGLAGIACLAAVAALLAGTPSLGGQEEGSAGLTENLVAVDADGNLFVVADQTLRPIAPPQTTDPFLASFCVGEPAGNLLPGALVDQGELLLGPDRTLWWLSDGTRKAVSPLPIGSGEVAPLGIGESLDLAGAESRTAAALAPVPTRRSGSEPPASGAGPVNYVDTHAHLVGSITGRDCDFELAIEDALAAMDRLGIQKTLIMPPPDVQGGCDSADLGDILRKYPQRFDLLGGGRSLNPMIHAAVRSGRVDADTMCAFEVTATRIIQDGAVGFGEMAALHLSFASTHPFEEAPPDHPLFLLLADLAARFDVPIDLHMDTVPEDTSFSNAQLATLIPVTTTNNPAMLRANVPAFERLLSHNRDARIVWAHVGADGTGLRSSELVRRLVEAHSNLYLQVRVIPGGTLPAAVLRGGGAPRPPPEGRPPPGGLPSGPASSAAIRPEWLELMRAFPDRFVLGSDRFYHPPGVGQPFITSIPAAQQETADRLYRTFLDRLPPDLARRIAYENAVRIYRLS